MNTLQATVGLISFFMISFYYINKLDKNRENNNCNKTSIPESWFTLILSICLMIYSFSINDELFILLTILTGVFSIITLIQPLLIRRKRRRNLNDKYISSKKP